MKEKKNTYENNLFPLQQNFPFHNIHGLMTPAFVSFRKKKIHIGRRKFLILLSLLLIFLLLEIVAGIFN